jgi:ATP-dependent Clp protease ATP-binding subunit ClpC
VLKNHHIDLKQSRVIVQNLVPSGPDIVTFGKLPLTRRSEQVIEASLEEARNFNRNLIGTEHLLLGLLQDQEGIAAIALRTLGLNLRDACNEVIGIYAAGSERSERRNVVSADNFCRRLGRMIGSFGRR